MINDYEHNGGFKDFLSEGYGTYIHSNGDIYVGEFKNGKRNGEGTLTRPEGKVESGRWENSKLVA